MEELKNVKILFATNYYDGFLDCFCEYENKIYRFEHFDENGWCNYESRKYHLIELELWQMVYEFYWHCILIANVKSYFKCLDSEYSMVNERFIIEENFYKKREKEYKEIDYSKNKIIGWFFE